MRENRALRSENMYFSLEKLLFVVSKKVCCQTILPLYFFTKNIKGALTCSV